jgi:uncharacterized protein (DUF1501 family)
VSPPPVARGCLDWHASHASQALPEGLVPVPAAALDGPAAAESGAGLSRRGLLAGGVGLLVGCAGLPGLTPQRLLEAAAAQAAGAADATILVSLYLDGGNDGLNTLVPLADPDYPRLRSRIGIAPASALPLAGVAEFGWHPSLTGLKQLYDAGKVAVLPSVDYAHPDLSHFNSSGYWRTGVVGPWPDGSGWLGRAVDEFGSADNPLQAISVTYGLDPVLHSRRAPVAAVYDPASFDFWIPGVWDIDGVLRGYRTLAGPRHGSQARRGVDAAYRNAIEMRDRLRPLGGTAPATPAAYPDTTLGKGLRNLARMLGAGLGTRVAAISAGGGYDTHEQQTDEHARLLADLGDSLAAWQADLEARALSSRVLTVVWSEFGRRPQDNDSLGTDHGSGALVLVVGDRANGGIRSEFPGLAVLDADDNMRVTTEFRTVYASLLESWLGIEAARVLPRIGAARLPLVAPA